MRTIQMTLNDDLVETVDKIIRELKTSRSAFTRDALRDAVNRFNIHRLEEKHRQGYALHPVKREEFSTWEKEQDWGMNEER
ncbi:MAG: ribbon-helix-helix protein, CopG family [Bacteroidetes bacterium]|nr:ribbon-helix-helix protein, CopG family [Bacteroidota bacterium]